MDKIVKLLLAQLGFVFLGVFLSLPFFVTKKEEEGTDVYWMISGLSLGTLFLAWYIFSKKYVRFNMQTWSLRSLKAVLLTILLSFSFFFLADSLGNWVNGCRTVEQWDKYPAKDESSFVRTRVPFSQSDCRRTFVSWFHTTFTT